jgi:hypothetical protein
MLERARGTVEVWASGVDRFTVRALGHEWVVVGFEEARHTAHALALDGGGCTNPRRAHWSRSRLIVLW